MQQPVNEELKVFTLMSPLKVLFSVTFTTNRKETYDICFVFDLISGIFKYPKLRGRF